MDTLPGMVSRRSCRERAKMTVELLSNSLYLLIMINPISKVFILSVIGKEAESPAEMRKISVHASMVAFFILITAAVGGNFLLSKVFHVEIYSLQVAGGMVLFYNGFKALTKGVFFEMDANNRLSDLSIVPLASPMIAGPATITLVITLASHWGTFHTVIAILVAVGCNMLIMLTTDIISGFLLRFNIMGALIRITGLLVATIAVQMIMQGLAYWHSTL
ncbi:MAG: MarC family protein [Planctomycetes bacterium]|nr:MarC family protein [Planctomycetota bacterium]